MLESVKTLTPDQGGVQTHTPTCHPDRPHYAKGLCKTCYTRPFRRTYMQQHRLETRLKRLGLTRARLEGFYKRAAGHCVFCDRTGQQLKPWRYTPADTVVALICWHCRRDSWIMGGLIGRRGVRWIERMVKMAVRSRPALRPIA